MVLCLGSTQRLWCSISLQAGRCKHYGLGALLVLFGGDPCRARDCPKSESRYRQCSIFLTKNLIRYTI